MKAKPAGLYANIAAKRERIAAGSKEKMRIPYFIILIYLISIIRKMLIIWTNNHFAS